MRNLISLFAGTLTLALLATASAATAGVVITATGGTAGNSSGQQTTIYLDPAAVKVEFGRGGAIYKEGAPFVTSYSDGDKSYMELSPERLSAARNRAMELMKQQLANMPPEQRKRIEEMMAKSGMGPAPAKPAVISFRKTAAGQRVGSWRCDQYEELQDGTKVAELCIAQLSELGLAENDLKALKSMSHMFAGLGAQAGQAAAAQFDLDRMKRQIGYAGLPVRTKEFRTGQQHEMTVQTIQRTSLPASTFEVPAGYTKRELPMQ